MTINKRYRTDYSSDRYAASRLDIGGNPFFNTHPDTQALLLDLFPGAVAAYSLRKLRNDYYGAAIRVRRSSDDAEQDIGFDGIHLDTASLLSFCGVGDGYVTTRYDQSGNGYDATQSTASAQMRIVSSGALEVDVNGNPALFSNGAQHSYLVATHAAIPQPWSVLNVSQYDRTTATIAWSSSPLCFNGYYDALKPLSLYAGKYLNRGTIATGRYVLFSVANGTSSTYSENGTAVTGDAGTNAIGANTLQLSGQGTSRELLGLDQEMIYWSGDLSANRTTVEADVNAYWGVY